MKKDLHKAYIALAIVSFFWGTTYIASRISALHIPGLFVSGVRQFISGLILVTYFLSRGYKIPDRKSLVKIGIQGVLLLCIANGALTWSLEYITSGLAAIIAGSVPLFIAVFSVVLLKFARLTGLMLTGLVVGFAGIITIFYQHLSHIADPNFAFGIGLAIVSTVSWSFGTVFTSRWKTGVDILFAVGLQMLIAGICLLLICFVTKKYVNLWYANHIALGGILYLITFGSLLAYSAYVFAISKLPPTQVSIYAYINPIVAVVLGWLLLHEEFSIHVITGTLITLCGVYLVNREFQKQKA
jgi:drug/metabolite transporter (DMT)-like permease